MTKDTKLKANLGKAWKNVQFQRIDSKILCENVSKGDDLNHELSNFFSIVQGRNGKKINKIEMALQSITKCFENTL